MKTTCAPPAPLLVQKRYYLHLGALVCKTRAWHSESPTGKVMQSAGWHKRVVTGRNQSRKKGCSRSKMIQRSRKSAWSATCPLYFRSDELSHYFFRPAVPPVALTMGESSHCISEPAVNVPRPVDSKGRGPRTQEGRACGLGGQKLRPWTLLLGCSTTCISIRCHQRWPPPKSTNPFHFGQC